MKKLNEIIAKYATIIFGTMWMFYAFFIYGLLPLIPSIQPYQNTIFYWSGWVQLWALPLLMVGQKVLGKDAEKRENESHDTIMKTFKVLHDELKLIKESLDIQKEERKNIHEIMSEIEAILHDMNNRTNK